MKPWLVWSSEDGILEEFETEQEAVNCANETLALWREESVSQGEWNDGVENIAVYRLAHHIVQSGDDEEGYDFKLQEAP